MSILVPAPKAGNQNKFLAIINDTYDWAEPSKDTWFLCDDGTKRKGDEVHKFLSAGTGDWGLMELDLIDGLEWTVKWTMDPIKNPLTVTIKNKIDVPINDIVLVLNGVYVMEFPYTWTQGTCKEDNSNNIFTWNVSTLESGKDATLSFPDLWPWPDSATSKVFTLTAPGYKELIGEFVPTISIK